MADRNDGQLGVAGLRWCATKIRPVEDRNMEITAGGRDLPSFDPHPWLRGGHAQTIVGRYWPMLRHGLVSTAHEIALDDGDRLVLLESTPPGWDGTRPTAMLVHGLAGCAEASVYGPTRGPPGGPGDPRGPGEPARVGPGVRAGPGHLPRGPERRPPGGRRLAQESGRSLADRRGRVLPRRQPGPEAGGGDGRRRGPGRRGLDCVVAANPPIDLATCGAG